jgi:hypothetical protein
VAAAALKDDVGWILSGTEVGWDYSPSRTEKSLDRILELHC